MDDGRAISGEQCWLMEGGPHERSGSRTDRDRGVFVLISLVIILINLIPGRFHPDSWFGPAVYVSLGITGFIIWWVIRKERT